MKNLRLLVPFSVFVLMLSACSPALVKETMSPTPEKQMEQSSELLMSTPTAAMEMSTKAPMDTSSSDMQGTTEPMSQSSDKMMDIPAWFSISLTDVLTGKSFMISDLKGKVVLVETMAQWCPNCKKQQQQVLELHKLVDNNPDLVTIVLDVDPNENADQLKKYAESNQFTWIYAIASTELSKNLADLYGTQFINPPATPMLVIDRKGTVTVLPLGTIKSAGDLQKAVEPLLKAGM